MLHVAFVRSPVAHGTIDSVDVGEAESMPGVVAVYHAAATTWACRRSRASR